MKTSKILFTILMIGILASCQLSDPSVTQTKSDAGDLASGGYVAIGNSLTAGYQSGGLMEDFQQYSFTKQIAEQMGVTTFAQPTISYPGLPSVLELKDLEGTIEEAPGTGQPTNLAYAKPYNNLGIPGIVLADVMLSTSTQSSTDQGLSGSGLIDVVLRGQGTVWQQAKAQQPSFITLWIGNNDVLGFATSGGASPASPTDANTFAFLFNQLGDSLATLNAKVAVANIPNVTDIPFFTTIGPKIAEAMAPALSAGAINGLYYQTHGETTVASHVTKLDGSDNVLITLVGGKYASLLGTPTGKWYRDLAAKFGIPVSALLSTMPGIDTTQAFGFHPQNPWPDALILDSDEIVTAKTAITSFNATIAGVASAHGWALVDINTFFGGVAAAGGVWVEQGIAMKTAYIEGEMFSLDGVHPSTAGYGVIANRFIEAINAKYGTAIAPVNLQKLRETAVSHNNASKISFSDHALENTLKILGAK